METTFTFTPYKDLVTNVSELGANKIHTNYYQLLSDISGAIIELFGRDEGSGVKIYDMKVAGVTVPPSVIAGYYSVYHTDFFTQVNIAEVVNATE